MTVRPRPTSLPPCESVLAEDARPAHWVLDAKHGDTPAWEMLVACEDLAALVREGLSHPRVVQIECGNALDPDDVLYFFRREPDGEVLRSNGWTFTSATGGF